MRLLTYYENDVLKLGIKVDGGVIDVAAAAQGSDLPTTPDAFFKAGLAAVAGLNTLTADTKHLLDEATLQIGPAVPNPGKILCIGLNYRQHAIETGNEFPATPVVFGKFGNTIAAHHEDIPYTAEYSRLDYEAELVVIIGKQARNVSEEDALDYVLGYCIGNDISERKLQSGLPAKQWLIGKSCDQFLPIGPYVVSADEAGDPQDMMIQGWLNGEIRQSKNTSDMIFTVAQCIAYISRFMTLEPGDIISTGTPEGVISGMDPKIWMKPGDEYSIEIGNLGRLSNKIVEA